MGAMTGLTDSVESNAEGDAWSAIIALGAVLSIIGCTAVCLVIRVHRKHLSSQTERVILYMAFSNIGYVW